MKPATASPTQEALAGLVERVTFHNAENGFCVLRTKARGHRDLVTVVGHSATIAAGECCHGWLHARIFVSRRAGVGNVAAEPVITPLPSPA